MKSKQNGLTVGELTMAIGALIIAGLLWTTINKKENSKNVSNGSLMQLINNNNELQITHLKGKIS